MGGLLLISLFSLCLECDFEESHLCGYSNQWNANVNWFVGEGGVHNKIQNKIGEYFVYILHLYTTRTPTHSHTYI